MSTKKKLREQEAEQEAQLLAEQRSGLLKWSYLAVCVLLLGAVIISLRSASFLMKNMRPSKDVMTNLDSYTPWPDQVREEFQKMLVQNGGRVKPINTFARFSLLQINNGTRVIFETKDGVKHKIKADEWLLDTLFRGEIAKELPIFNVDDTDVIAALGVKPKNGSEHHRKRDRYAYNDLAPARPKFAEEGQRVNQKKTQYEDSQEDPQLAPTREELLALRISRNISFFEYFLGQFGAIQKGDNPMTTILPPELARLTAGLDMTEFITKYMPEMSPQQLMQILEQPTQNSEEQLFQAPFKLFSFYAQTGTSLVIMPPSDRMKDEWGGIGHLMFEGMMDKSKRDRVASEMSKVAAIHEGQKAMFSSLKKADNEKAQIAAAEPVAKLVADFVEGQKAEAKARYEARVADLDKQIAANSEPLEDERLKDRKDKLKVEGGSADREVKLYNSGYFHSSLAYFILGFLILAVSWFLPGSKFAKVVSWVALGFIILALGYDVIGIIQRCVVRARPPITNLYDTVIFITAVVVILALILEYFTRRGVGLILAAIGGMGGMFLSLRYEVKEATDTMDPLQAVLDTNFWLATHVTTINIGYAAGLLAMLLGMFYLLHRFLKPLPRVLGLNKGTDKNTVTLAIFEEDKKTRDFSKSIFKMTYGIICFCLLFSIVGTVLGGVWANYSWGRFWGWDPKENGALMICLWSLVILHAKMGGFIREIGMAVNAVFLGMIVTFSWWGVNNLGIGLHSYGFTQGVWDALYIGWTVCGFIMACGIPLAMHERFKKSGKKNKSARKKKDPVTDSDLAEGGAPA